MNDNALATTTATKAAPAVWGERSEVAQIARRLKYMLPGGQKLTDEQAFAAAQYAQLTGLDPFAAGFFAMPGGGITQHYAVIVNWAQSKAPYSERFLPLTADELQVEGIEKGAIAWKCYVLRDDRAHLLAGYLGAGMPFTEALDFLAAKGIGFVTKKDQTGKNGKPIDPPKGWTWAKVAQKRALRAALALSHGKPTAVELRQIAETLYQNSPAGRLESLEAQVTTIKTESAGMSAGDHATRLKENVTLLRGPEDDPLAEQIALDLKSAEDETNSQGNHRQQIAG